MFSTRRGRATTAPVPAGTPDRVERRKRNRAILKSVLVAAIAVDTALGGLLVYLIFMYVPYFNLQEVDVTGTKRLSRDEIVEASEIEAGINLLTVDLGAVTERLKRHPWIRSASVYRRFPGRLIMEIEERSPRAILAAEKLYYVDEQAEYFSRLLPGDSISFPLFTGVTPSQLESHGLEIREMLRLGLGLVDLLERSGSDPDISRISEIRMDLDDGLSVHTKSGRIVVLGKGEFERKLKRYAGLKKFLIRRGQWHTARIINLDFEDRALVRSSDKPSHQG
ncbi:MAG: FtsQ-type POTRA domain-containing protein [Desulfomonilaceae bacterium]|nr:FtsQ-type POTRA domain-containing protein [Desulfomonilaceae bacterium]